MIIRGRGEFTATVESLAGDEYEITVKYHGYSDPGRLSGPPEDCYPPEGEIELEFIGIPDGVEFDNDAIQERLEQEAFDRISDDSRYRWHDE